MVEELTPDSYTTLMNIHVEVSCKQLLHTSGAQTHTFGLPNINSIEIE